MPANPNLESVHVYNLPKGTKERIRKKSKKFKTSANKYVVELIKSAVEK